MHWALSRTQRLSTSGSEACEQLQGRLLQLKLPEEVQADAAVAQRSKATGNLSISMPKERPTGSHLKSRYHPFLLSCICTQQQMRLGMVGQERGGGGCSCQAAHAHAASSSLRWNSQQFCQPDQGAKENLTHIASCASSKFRMVSLPMHKKSPLSKPFFLEKH